MDPGNLQERSTRKKAGQGKAGLQRPSWGPHHLSEGLSQSHGGSQLWTHSLLRDAPSLDLAASRPTQLWG